MRPLLLLLASAVLASAQLGQYSKEQRVDYTRAWQGERFEDGRPKVPDSILERMRLVTAEEAWAVLRQHGYRDHFESAWKRFGSGPERLVGRAVTAQFLPFRPDVDAVIVEHGEGEGRVGPGQNSWVIDTLQPGDVPGVGLLGKYNFMGDNLATAIYEKTGKGVVIDGGLRDLSGILEIEGFQGFVRSFHPSSVTHGWRNTMLMGMNVPVRIGETTVMPGDIVLSDPEGLVFIPAHLAEAVVEASEETRARDEWGQMMLRQGKYGPGEIDTEWTPEMEAEFEAWRRNR